MLITETKLDRSIYSSELMPKGYVGEFRRGWILNGGGVMILTNNSSITDLLLPTATQNETELVWATITLKYPSKLMVGSFYRPPNKEVIPILELENQLVEITDTVRNNPKTTLILGGEFNARNIDWETGLVPDDSPNRLLCSNDSRLHVVEPPRGRYVIWQIGVNSSIQDRRQVDRVFYGVESVVPGNAHLLLN